MESRTQSSCRQRIVSPEDGQQRNRPESRGDSKEKKKGRKKPTTLRKTKPSPVMRLDEETLATGTASDNGAEELSNDTSTNNNPTPQDENVLLHQVLCKILNRKKMLLLQTDEVRAAIALKTQKKCN